MFLLKLTFKNTKKIENDLQKKIIKLKNDFKEIEIENSGIYKIKDKKKIFTLLKSPHVNKKSLEHFKYSYYVQKIDFKFSKFNELLNFLIFIKKKYSQNMNINIKIVEKM